MAESPEHNSRAIEMMNRLFPHSGPQRMAQLERLDPEFRRMWEDLIFGGLYSREVLDQKTRELCAVAAITALRVAPQLRMHIIASVRAGATRAEIQEAIMQAAVYAGFPAALGGLDIMEAVWRELDSAPGSGLPAGDRKGDESG
jgi:4-carboxymuconolactone decarboxylase